jgi:hypothetical protein
MEIDKKDPSWKELTGLPPTIDSEIRYRLSDDNGKGVRSNRNEVSMLDLRISTTV